MSELGRTRHRARERALELAYEAQSKDRSLATIIAEQRRRPDAYAIEILESVERHRERIDELISASSLAWRLERIATIDRLVMSLALGELLMDDAPPTAVVLDEAIELAKVYSTENSGAFVNGVLVACVAHLK